MNQCPWDAFTPGTNLLCEESLCSWVVMPGNIASGFAYLLVAFLIYRHQKKTKTSLHWTFRVYWELMFFTGVSAFLYYSSRIFFFQAFDLGSMYFFGALLIVIELKRLVPAFHANLKQVITFAVLGITPTLLFIFHPKHPGVMSFLLLLGVALSLQSVSIFKGAVNSCRNYLIALGLLLLGVCAIIAEKKGLCDPQNHLFQWHAAWNFAAASACFFLYRHLSSPDNNSNLV